MTDCGCDTFLGNVTMDSSLTVAGKVGIDTTTPTYLADIFGAGGWLLKVGNADSGQNLRLSPNAVGSFANSQGAVLALNPDGGSVGVNTATPGYVLDVAGSSGWLLKVGQADPYANVRVSDNAVGAFVNGSGSSLGLNPGGGNVGVGTAAPQYPLDVQASVRDVLNVQSGGTNGAALHINGGRDYALLSSSSGNSEGADKLILYDASTSPWTARLTLDASGNLGLGTTAPQYPLDVNGSARVSGVVLVGQDVTLNGAINRSTGGALVDQIGCYYA